MKVEILEKWFETHEQLSKDNFDMLKEMYKLVVDMVSPKTRVETKKPIEKDEIIITKKCTKCGLMKPGSGYAVNNANKDKLQTWCRECMSRANKDRRLKVAQEKGGKWNKFKGTFKHSAGDLP